MGTGNPEESYLQDKCEYSCGNITGLYRVSMGRSKYNSPFLSGELKLSITLIGLYVIYETEHEKELP